MIMAKLERLAVLGASEDVEYLYSSSIDVGHVKLHNNLENNLADS